MVEHIGLNIIICCHIYKWPREHPIDSNNLLISTKYIYITQKHSFAFHANYQKQITISNPNTLRSINSISSHTSWSADNGLIVVLIATCHSRKISSDFTTTNANRENVAKNINHERSRGIAIYTNCMWTVLIVLVGVVGDCSSCLMVKFGYICWGQREELKWWSFHSKLINWRGPTRKLRMKELDRIAFV